MFQQRDLETFQSQLLSASPSFTLIELLVVVALLAILAVAVVTIINPAELLRQARDSTRLSDLSSLNRMLSLYETDSVGVGFMGTSTVVYISVPDTSVTCANLGLPPLPSGWSYHCVTEDNLRNIDGSGWVPVNFNLVSSGVPLAKLPVDPVNTASTNQYYVYVTGGSWELKAVMESAKYKTEAQTDGGYSDNAYEIGSDLALAPLVFPDNWIKIPGSSTYGTSDFWVMKYEAKYSRSGGAKGDDVGNCYYFSSADTWDWGKSGSDCPVTWSNTNVLSSPYGSPIAGVTHAEAKAICASLGAHLITNQEWMTIARNVEQVTQNWSGGAVGSGCLFQGNVGKNSNCSYNGDDPEKGIGRNPKAKLKLSNGEEIWDLSGNVWEHVQKDSSDTLVNNQPSDGGIVMWRWIDHTAITDYGDLSYDEIRPSNISWGVSQGMGQVYTYNGAYANRVLRRGGSAWDYNVHAGVFALDLYWNTGSQLSNVGFRCAR